MNFDQTDHMFRCKISFGMMNTIYFYFYWTLFGVYALENLSYFMHKPSKRRMGGTLHLGT